MTLVEPVPSPLDRDRAVPTECHGGADCRLSQIVQGPISFYALCEHHALPLHGVAHVAHEEIFGISKLTRLVRLFARRFTLQERIGQQIAAALTESLRPHGVAVRLEAEHLCTQMRGVRDEQSKTVTTHWTAPTPTIPHCATSSCRKRMTTAPGGEHRCLNS